MKLLRLFIVLIVAILIFIGLYCILPLVCFIFGGGFLEVAQNYMYVMYGGIASICGMGSILHNCIDGDTLKFKS